MEVLDDRVESHGTPGQAGQATHARVRVAYPAGGYGGNLHYFRSWTVMIVCHFRPVLPLLVRRRRTLSTRRRPAARGEARVEPSLRTSCHSCPAPACTAAMHRSESRAALPAHASQPASSANTTTTSASSDIRLVQNSVKNNMVDAVRCYHIVTQAPCRRTTCTPHGRAVPEPRGPARFKRIA